MPPPTHPQASVNFTGDGLRGRQWGCSKTILIVAFQSRPVLLPQSGEGNSYVTAVGSENGAPAAT